MARPIPFVSPVTRKFLPARVQPAGRGRPVLFPDGAEIVGSVADIFQQWTTFMSNYQLLTEIRTNMTRKE